MLEYAYFISPRGKIIPVTRGKHIDQIISEPITFGLLVKDMVSTYKRHNETFGHEGFARDEIIAGLFRKGWVRVRFEERRTLIFQLGRFTMGAKKHILSFLELVQASKIKPGNNDGRHFSVAVYQVRESPIAEAGSVKGTMRQIKYGLAPACTEQSRER
ncbi:MAG: hypothetical protein WC637_20385, partial [Victivallales bacterium]